MVNFANNWLFRPHFDYEYKSYQILGYAQRLQSQFAAHKFFPYLLEVKQQLEALNTFQRHKDAFEAGAQGEVEKIDWQELKLVRAALGRNDDFWEEVEAVMNFASQNFEKCRIQGESELLKVEEAIQVSEVGLTNYTIPSGCIFFRKPYTTRLYSFDLRIVRRPNPDESFKDVKTTYLDEIKTGLVTNYGNLKWKFLKSDAAHGQNAYLVETASEIPHIETLMPIVKTILLQRYQE